MTKRKKTIVAAFAILGIAVVGLAAGVYAKYIASISGTGTATVAKWAFTTDNTADSVGCSLGDTYDPKTLVNGKIAPGTEGQCTIELKNETSDVGVDYKIKLGNVSGKPENMKFYTDAGHQNLLAADGTGSITGHLDAPNSGAADAVTTKTETIYWKWEYETGSAKADGTVDNEHTGDAVDTTAGESGSSLTFNFAIQAWQTEPVAQP